MVPSLVDIWSITEPLLGGESLVLEIDTVSAATTFDPLVTLAELNEAATSFVQLDQGDDEMTCSFPPPQFACPRVEFTVPAGGGVYSFVVAQASENCAGALAEYSVSVTINSVPSVPVLPPQGDNVLDTGLFGEEGAP